MEAYIRVLIERAKELINEPDLLSNPTYYTCNDLYWTAIEADGAEIDVLSDLIEEVGNKFCKKNKIWITNTFISAMVQRQTKLEYSHNLALTPRESLYRDYRMEWLKFFIKVLED